MDARRHALLAASRARVAGRARIVAARANRRGARRGARARRAMDAEDAFEVIESSSLKDTKVGIVLAVSSALAIGTSFIVKKKGLQAAAASVGGVRASAGGYGYLSEPLWWIGVAAMASGEVCNFAAYAYAPATIVTPLGALSIIISAVLAHYVLRERLTMSGWVGCALCVAGSVEIVLHAPEEAPAVGVQALAALAMKPLFVLYSFSAIASAAWLAIEVAPKHGNTYLLVPIMICSLMGSLSVVSCKTLGLALKMTFHGKNQLFYAETWVCVLCVVICVVTQMNYLNKALDRFNTAIVTPVYYVCFTTLTLTASSVMYEDYMRQSTRDVIASFAGFVTILCGVFVLTTSKDGPDVAKQLKRSATSTRHEQDEELADVASPGRGHAE